MNDRTVGTRTKRKRKKDQAELL